MDINFIFYVTMCCLILLMFVVIFAVLRGPTMIDRVLAINIIGTKVVSLLVLIGILLGKLDMYIDLEYRYSRLILENDYYNHALMSFDKTCYEKRC